MKLIHANWYMKNITGLFSKDKGANRGFTAQYAVFWIFFKDKKDMTNQVLLNHELIHHEQVKELTPFLFLPVYLGNYVINLFRYKFDTDKAYRNILLEKEAYQNENNHTYRRNRKRYAWLFK
ncbi:hypothetical protein [Cytophaga hutchinsonii]|uniref:DUF4157 domain-containing protein n=2 Tax=Cytophaga hutchinsonii TaxID=985 RepID=A0A6N4SNE9_CYTH3|nr:hypothetical protein [Cytophaga hutchinsonii]ABG57814.1 hypothetical protein CHU_0527 [Cytophaga hutchinsonii ATCC 33406]SFX06280.1 hypothetical protein SAMN04487930_101366 [Cytophaga hutchinsonii ATCC 33406]